MQKKKTYMLGIKGYLKLIPNINTNLYHKMV